MQTGGPIIVYRNGPAPSGAPKPQSPPTSVQPVTWIGDLSLDPVRSKGDEPLGGQHMPVFGPLPVLNEPAPRDNVWGRIARGRLSMTAVEYQSFRAFERSHQAGAERVWFDLNPGTWPVIKINGAQKLASAKALNGIVTRNAADILPQRRFSAEHIADLRRMENELLDDVAWHASDWAAAANVLAGIINALSATALGVLSIFKPMGLVLTALYGSVDEMFRKGGVCDRAAWEDAIKKALMEAAADDMITGGNDLRVLLLEFAKLAKRLIEIQDNEDERIELKHEIERQLKAIRDELDKYQRYYDRPRVAEAVVAELKRQPDYVIAVATQYIRKTGKPIAVVEETRADCPFALQGLSKACFPIYALLWLRGREAAVQAFDIGI